MATGNGNSNQNGNSNGNSQSNNSSGKTPNQNNAGSLGGSSNRGSQPTGDNNLAKNGGQFGGNLGRQSQQGGSGLSGFSPDQNSQNLHGFGRAGHNTPGVKGGNGFAGGNGKDLNKPFSNQPLSKGLGGQGSGDNGLNQAGQPKIGANPGESENKMGGKGDLGKNLAGDLGKKSESAGAGNLGGKQGSPNLSQKAGGAAKNLGGKVIQGYKKLNGIAVRGVMRMGTRFGLRNKYAQWIVNLAIASAIGGSVLHGVMSSNGKYSYDQQFVCQTTNDSGNEYLGDNDRGVKVNKEVNGPWITNPPLPSDQHDDWKKISIYSDKAYWKKPIYDKKGRLIGHKNIPFSPYAVAYATYRASKTVSIGGHRLDDQHAAAVTGNAFYDSGYNPDTKKFEKELAFKPRQKGHDKDGPTYEFPNLFYLAIHNGKATGEDKQPVKQSIYDQMDKFLPQGGHFPYAVVDSKQKVNFKYFWQTQGSISFLTSSFVDGYESLNKGGHINWRINAGRKAQDLFLQMTSDLPNTVESADNNTAKAEKENNYKCNTFGYGDQGVDDKLVKMARNFLGNKPDGTPRVPYSQGKRDQIHGNTLQTAGGYADSTSYIWWVLKETGYQVPLLKNFTTENLFKGDMTNSDRSDPGDRADPDDFNSMFRQISPISAKKGDIAVIIKNSRYLKKGKVTDHGNYGHAVLLLQNWHGPDTMVIGEGGSEGKVNISTFGEACYPTFHFGQFRFVRPLARGDY